MSARPEPFGRVVALAGGVGGARLLEGLAAVLAPDALVAVVNTGDDLVHLGLPVCPDLDTVMYTLAGLADRARGWGLEDETFRAMEMVGRYGGASWFALGDRDIGTHLARLALLSRGLGLTDVTERLRTALGVSTRLLPMCDAPRRTMIDTIDAGTLPFQDWLVRTRAGHAVRAVRYEGATTPTPQVRDALASADLVVLCPSNPYVSIDPILTLEGVREAVDVKPVIALSPIVHGQAVKGPLAAMLDELEGLPATPASILRHYGGLVDALVVEHGDDAGIDVPVLATRTVMGDRDDRARLAGELLDFAARVLR